MNNSRLSKLINIYNINVTRGVFGENKETKTLLASVWCDVIQLKGDKLVYSQVVTDVQTLQFVIRYRHDITKQQIIGYNNDYYRIINYENIGKKSLIKLTCTLIEDN